MGSTDQVSKIRTFNIAPTWTRIVNTEHGVHAWAGSRGRINTTTIPAPIPSADLIPDLQTNTIGQNRRLTNLGLRASVSMVKGIHNIKVGFTWEDTILTEKDSFRDRRSDV